MRESFLYTVSLKACLKESENMRENNRLEREKNMTNIENLCFLAMEECAELSQAVSKSARFGSKNHHPDHPDKTNEEDIIREFYQLQAVMDMLYIAGYIRRPSEQEINRIMDSKKRSIGEWQKVSEEYGLVINTDSKIADVEIDRM